MFRCFDAVGRERTLNMAGARNRFVFAVVSVQLINVLADEKCFDAVARQESQRFLKDVELSQRWKFVKHEQKAVLGLYLGEVGELLGLHQTTISVADDRSG
jgi:hypothetical protein